jgi:hypothetical protein
MTEPLFPRHVVGADPRVFPALSKSYVTKVLFKTSGGVVTSQPTYAVTSTQYGDSRVVRPAGTLISPQRLVELRESVLDDLAKEGFVPTSAIHGRDVAKWDRVLGASLVENLDIAPYQRHSEDVWTYLTVCVFWEFPTWRFPPRSSGQKGDKDFSRSVGVPRNVLRKCWLRAWTLGPDLLTDEFPTAAPLGEDELVNLFERTVLGNNEDLVKDLVRTIYRNQPRQTGRSEVIREFAKLVLRRTPSIAFLALSEVDRAAALDVLFARASQLANRVREDAGRSR